MRIKIRRETQGRFTCPWPGTGSQLACVFGAQTLYRTCPLGGALGPTRSRIWKRKAPVCSPGPTHGTTHPRYQSATCSLTIHMLMLTHQAHPPLLNLCHLSTCLYSTFPPLLNLFTSSLLHFFTTRSLCFSTSSLVDFANSWLLHWSHSLSFLFFTSSLLLHFLFPNSLVTHLVSRWLILYSASSLSYQFFTSEHLQSALLHFSTSVAACDSTDIGGRRV